MRLVYFIRAEPIYGDPYYNFSDSVTNVIIWSVIEACFSIIAANLPYVFPHSFRPGRVYQALPADHFDASTACSRPYSKRARDSAVW